MKKTLPGCIEDFREVMEKNKYYVDKTSLIAELLDNDMKITLITRPRRFGKTLNMTMIREFFDISVDSKTLFEDKEIMTNDEYKKYRNRLNSAPVVYITFKGCEGEEKEELIDSIQFQLKKEYDKHNKEFKDKNKISKETYEDFEKTYGVLRNDDVYSNFKKISNYIKRALLILTKTLYEYYDIKPIVLLDEYDSPFIEAKTKGYYKEVRTTLSGLFGNTFKENTSIERGILTGIQRIAQESIFSKFNNPDICTLTNPKYCDKFGLTRTETKEYLEYFGFKLNDKIKDYYDGYKIGNQDEKLEENVTKLFEKGLKDKKYKLYEAEVYNPMSITSYISNSGALESYWVDTSSNSLIVDELSKADDFFYEDFDKVINNIKCTTNIDLITTFDDKQTTSRLWGLLLNAGYITVEEFIKNGRYKIKIPNEEVRTAFKKIVAEVIDTPTSILDELFEALQARQMDRFAYIYKDILMRCTSYFDAKSKENSYHMLMLGMAAYLVPRFKVESNKERGTGRPDIAIYKKRCDDLNVIIEYKHDDDGNVENKSNHLIKDAKEALEQIKEKKYYTDMDGEVMLIGIAHNKKEAEVLYELVNVKNNNIVN